MLAGFGFDAILMPVTVADVSEAYLADSLTTGSTTGGVGSVFLLTAVCSTKKGFGGSTVDLTGWLVVDATVKVSGLTGVTPNFWDSGVVVGGVPVGPSEYAAEGSFCAGGIVIGLVGSPGLSSVAGVSAGLSAFVVSLFRSAGTDEVEVVLGVDIFCMSQYDII